MLDLFAPVEHLPVAPALVSRDVTASGPHRFHLAAAADTRRRVVMDRATGAVVFEGLWLVAWGRALRANGLIPDPEASHV